MLPLGNDFSTAHDDMMERTARRPNRASYLPCYFTFAIGENIRLGRYDERHDVSKLSHELDNEDVSACTNDMMEHNVHRTSNDLNDVKYHIFS